MFCLLFCMCTCMLGVRKVLRVLDPHGIGLCMVVCNHRCWEPNACPLRVTSALLTLSHLSSSLIWENKPSNFSIILHIVVNGFLSKTIWRQVGMMAWDYYQELKWGIIWLYIYIFIYIVILVCFYIAVIKDSDQKQLGETKGLFSLLFAESERKPRQEPGCRMKQWPQKNAASDLFHWLVQPDFLYHQGLPTCPGMALSTVNWDIPYHMNL